MRSAIVPKDKFLWYRDVLSLMEVLWIDGSMHNLAHELWLGFGRRKLSSHILARIILTVNAFYEDGGFLD